MIHLYPGIFDKYFSDLAKIINFLIIHSEFLKKIVTNCIVNPICNFLLKENINLLYKPSSFRRYIIAEIYDFLRENHQKSFPYRTSWRKTLSKNEYIRLGEDYRTIIGNRIKIYIIKHIYNGFYLEDGKISCHECKKERFSINTDISRLSSLEFHHETKNKTSEFTTNLFTRLFESNRFNPLFLEEQIKLMESKKVRLLCRNHHRTYHNKTFYYFKHLINWKSIYSLPAKLIRVIIKVSVENFKKTMNLSEDTRYYIQYNIVGLLKRRYIIQSFYGEYCHTCGEININNYLPSFDFHHSKGLHFHHNPFINTKIKSVSYLFRQSYTCSEIAKILE